MPNTVVIIVVELVVIVWLLFNYAAFEYRINGRRAKWKSKISRVAAASNNSKIITIQRSANECIIKINVSRVSRCHMPADKPTTANKPIENAMRIAVSMRTHDSYTQHDPSFCILGRLCLTLRNKPNGGLSIKILCFESFNWNAVCRRFLIADFISFFYCVIHTL